MKYGPDIARVGSLIGDPARANMLACLMEGRALTASELAAEAGVTAQTASSHLSRLEDGGLISRRKQGRHHYFALANNDVAALLEAMMGLAARSGHLRTRTGPADPALRLARVCYDHLAGEKGVQLLDSLIARQLVVEDGDYISLTEEGRNFVEALDIDPVALAGARRPLCRPCLDWSERRSHLAGALGAALLNRFYEQGWARRQTGSRVVLFTPAGEKAFARLFPQV